MSIELRSITIFNTITDMIRQGVFPEGKLWSEDVLCERLDVSRTTLREALKLLERDGIISKKHGIGNFIHTSALNVRMRFDKFADFSRLLEDGGYTVRVTRQIPRPAESAEVLASTGHALPGPCLYQEKTSMVEGDNVATFAWHYLRVREDVWHYYAATPPPTELMAEHATLPFIDFMENITGLEQAQTIIYLEPVVADSRVASALQLAEGTPLIRFREEHYSFTDVLCGVGHVYFDPSIVKLAALRKWL